jgi:hypothetical protein
MELRSELLPPALDEAKVSRLAGLAAALDGARPGQWEGRLEAFNREAGTSLSFADFQGISGGMGHDTWVRCVLAQPSERRVADVTREGLLELIQRVAAGEGEEHEISYWLRLLEANVPDPRLSDLFFWPGEYFGDGDNSRAWSPEQILDIASGRAATAATGSAAGTDREQAGPPA